MKFIDIKSLYRETNKYLDQIISVAGWVRTVRLSKDFGFIELNDGTFLKNLQIVFDRQLNNFSEIEKLSLGSAIRVEGQLVKSPAPLQPFELRANNIKILGPSDNSYPLQKKKHSLEFLRDIAHLRVRSTTFSSVFRVRSVLSLAIHQFFQERGFSYVHTPIISSSDCEGAGEMFTITTMDLAQPIVKTPTGQVDYSRDFFGQKVGLTVSGQLEAEALIFGLNRVYTFGPTFRAENSNTTRHACEFWMIEPEMAFADLVDIMDLAEEMVRYLISYILEILPEEIDFFNHSTDNTLLERLQKTVKADFIRLSYSEAIDLLLKSKQHFQYPVSWGVDLQTEHERYITEKIFGQPVFLTD
ncbi:MAG TPA: asparagine--tRNA ligase, partial [bacterium]|nr:asparagine--tRNA ligase [bacterium]